MKVADGEYIETHEVQMGLACGCGGKTYRKVKYKIVYKDGEIISREDLTEEK